MKRRVHQLLAGFAEGDAVSLDATLLRGALRRLGFESEIFVEEGRIAAGAAEDCRPASQCPTDSGTTLILHYSTAAAVNTMFTRADGTRVLRYHNITPAEFFTGFDDRHAEQLRRGRADLSGVAARADAIWAVSAYNASELEAAGLKPVRVLPLLFSTGRFAGPGDPAVEGRFGDGLTNWLFVGRMAPNKCVEELMLAFHWYHAAINPLSRLILVGSPHSCPRYYAMLRMLAADFHMSNVCFEGFLLRDALVACYRQAHVYISTSRHEGYCLPLVEAMHAGIPVLARRTGGTPEALEGAGVLFEELQPEWLGELVHRVLSDPALRKRVRASQRRRVEALRARRPEKELQSLLEALPAD